LKKKKKKKMTFQFVQDSWAESFLESSPCMYEL
jgi:hypothetical protein